MISPLLEADLGSWWIGFSTLLVVTGAPYVGVQT